MVDTGCDNYRNGSGGYRMGITEIRSGTKFQCDKNPLAERLQGAIALEKICCKLKVNH